MPDHDKTRRRVQALRAKAESTTFPAEAEALRAKADELEKSLPQPERGRVMDEPAGGSDAQRGPSSGQQQPTSDEFDAFFRMAQDLGFGQTNTGFSGPRFYRPPGNARWRYVAGDAPPHPPDTVTYKCAECGKETTTFRHRWTSSFCEACLAERREKARQRTREENEQLWRSLFPDEEPP